MKAAFSVSIRSILLAGFCGLTAIGIGSALYLGLAAGFQNTRELLSENIEGFVDWMVDEIDGRLRPVELQAHWVAERIADGTVLVGPSSSARTDFFFRTVLASTPEAGAVAVITVDGQFHGWSHGTDGMLREDWSDRPGVMNWVLQGHEDHTPEWGPPIWISSLDSAAIVYEVPLRSARGYLGYLVFTVLVSDLSRHLTTIDEKTFVLVGETDVLAHPLMIDWRPIDAEALPSASSIYSGQSALVPIAELGDSILERIWDAEYQDLVMVDKGKNFAAVAADIGDRQFVFVYRTITDYGPRPWTVGAYFDADAEDATVERLKAALFAGVAVILVALVLGLFVAKAIGRPIRALAEASATVETGQFDQVGALPTSRITELNSAISSFEGMVAGLAEREVIRRTLGRYVPESIAEQLLRDDGSLKPVEAEVTILFSDIAGFTAMTETLGPSRTVEFLNAFFSAMTEIIENEGGVITQFQGDAILAIFNTPIEAADHAERACRAAARMLTESTRRTFVGERVRCRIGINSGNVVAGAVGAEGRLTYTVHGDAVNLAARVEAMNKKTGTDLLITESTASQVKSFALRRVGQLDVRGQREAVTVYTIDIEALPSIADQRT